MGVRAVFLRGGGRRVKPPKCHNIFYSLRKYRHLNANFRNDLLEKALSDLNIKSI